MLFVFPLVKGYYMYLFNICDEALGDEIVLENEAAHAVPCLLFEECKPAKKDATSHAEIRANYRSTMFANTSLFFRL